MNIAYVFFGQVKNFDQKQYEAFSENIEKQLSAHNVDYFLTTSESKEYSNPRTKEESTINPYSINDFFDFKEVFYDGINTSKEKLKIIKKTSEELLNFGGTWKNFSEISTLNSMKQIYGLDFFYNLFEKYKEKYDLIILSRCDLFHSFPLNLNFLNEDWDIAVPHFNIYPEINYGHYNGLNDRFAVFRDFNSLKVYCSRFPTLRKYPEKYHAEEYLKKHISNFNLKVKKIDNLIFSLYRSNQIISDVIGIYPEKTYNKNLKNIDKSFFINLDRRTDRLISFYRTNDFFSQRISATDSKFTELGEDIKKLFPKTWNSRKKSEICCALSHYKLWKKLIEDNSSQNYLILEDDVVFEKGFSEFWNKIFSNFVPESYNLIYLGGCQPWNKPKYHEAVKRYNDYFYNVKKNDFFSKGDHFWHMTTCSYIISKQAANLMCQYIDQFGMDKPLDFFMLRFFDNNKLFSDPDSVFHLNPLMARQIHEENGNTAIDEKSDIRHDQSFFKETQNNCHTIKPKSTKQPSKNITKLIHQSWKTKNIPHSIYKKEWIDSWKQKNPGWEYKFWTDEDNRNLVKEFYPQYLELYDSYERPIAKADISRFFYMHKHGGLYADLDFMCLKSMDLVIDGEKINLGKQKMQSEFLSKNSIPNALIYSPPGEIFWIQCIEELKHHKYNQDGSLQSTENATGPIFLGKCIDKFKPQNLLIHKESAFYPISWELDGSNFNKTIKKEWIDNPKCEFPDSFAITFWSGGWRKSVKACKRKMIILSDNLFEEDFIDELFNDVEYEKVFDAKLQTIEDNSIIVYSDVFPKNLDIYPEKHRKFLLNRRRLLQDYFSKCINCTLIHLSDEHCLANIDHYKNFKHIFRQYYREDAVADNVTFIPLGYKKGFKHE